MYTIRNYLLIAALSDSFRDDKTLGTNILNNTPRETDVFI